MKQNILYGNTRKSWFKNIMDSNYKKFFYILITLVISLAIYSGIKSLITDSMKEKMETIPIIGKIFSGNKSKYLTSTALSVQSIAVKKEKITPTVIVLGTIEHFEKAIISSKSPGRIEHFYKKEGEEVKKGEPLVQIERLMLELELSRTDAALKAAQSQFRLSREKYDLSRRDIEMRMKEIEKKNTQVKDLKSQLDKTRSLYSAREALFKIGGISKEEFNASRTDLITAEAKFITAKKDLEISSIGYRPEDLKNKGFEVPADPVLLNKAYVNLNTLTEKAQVDVAEANVRSAEASKDTTAALLKASTIISPINGIVATRSKNVGEQVIVGTIGATDQGIMVVVDIDQVYVRMNIPESELNKLKLGSQIYFTSDLFHGKQFTAIIKIISPIIDEKSHTFEIKAIVANKNKQFKPGMFVRARLATGNEESLILLPSTAILPVEGNTASVYVLKQSKTYRKEVKTGRLFENRIEIVSGLEIDEIVVTDKLNQLRDGMPVKPVITGNGEL